MIKFGLFMVLPYIKILFAITNVKNSNPSNALSLNNCPIPRAAKVTFTGSSFSREPAVGGGETAAEET